MKDKRRDVRFGWGIFPTESMAESITERWGSDRVTVHRFPCGTIDCITVLNPNPYKEDKK